MKAITIPIILGITIPVYVANGSSESEDKVSCYERGFRDGEEHPFDQYTYGDCGNDCYRGFIDGCISVEGNTEEDCELAH